VAADVDRHARVGARPNKTGLSVNAVERDVLAHDHVAKEAAGDRLVSGLAVDVLEERAGTWLRPGCRKEHGELAIRLHSGGRGFIQGDQSVDEGAQDR
jgi:hypothetical protein